MPLQIAQKRPAHRGDPARATGPPGRNRPRTFRAGESARRPGHRAGERTEPPPPRIGGEARGVALRATIGHPELVEGSRQPRNPLRHRLDALVRARHRIPRRKKAAPHRSLPQPRPDRRRPAHGRLRIYADFEDIRRYKDAVEARACPSRLSRRRRARANSSRHAAHPKGGRAGLLQADRKRAARRRPHPQPRRARLFQGQHAPPHRRFFAQRRQSRSPPNCSWPRGSNGSPFPTISTRARCSIFSAPRRPAGSRSRCTSTSRCFTWSTASSRRFSRTAPTTPTAAGPATRIASSCATGSG
jgi:hypothetical protein